MDLFLTKAPDGNAITRPHRHDYGFQIKEEISGSEDNNTLIHLASDFRAGCNFDIKTRRVHIFFSCTAPIDDSIGNEITSLYSFNNGSIFFRLPKKCSLNRLTISVGESLVQSYKLFPGKLTTRLVTMVENPEDTIRIYHSKVKGFLN